MEAVVELCEAPHPEIRELLTKALLADEKKEHDRYRIDPKTLTADAVYRFCESLDAPTRALGMRLIAAHPELAVPEELFRLTESPDRQVRAFVIRTMWGLYRDKGITQHWRPAPPPASAIGKKADAKATATPPQGAAVAQGGDARGPAARPEKPPASGASLLELLRRALFTVPPGRLPKDGGAAANAPAVDAGAKGAKRARPLPARKAKLGLIEVIRDLAIDDGAFAALVAPLLREFMASRGASERAACLVALTRIQKAHPVSKDAA